ncbi:MAG: hypothetical protein EPN97_06070 [Alphaproteobacteria bacterium]|nr:MAG: hypothetical protein EPN97_06070 [Alphaproteobacteria bacterium]
MQNVLMKLRLKPGALPKFREYMAEFESRRAECEASLAGEGTLHEIFWLDGETVYVYKQVHNLKDTRAFQKSSGMPIYDVMRRMLADCVENTDEFHAELEFGR